MKRVFIGLGSNIVNPVHQLYCAIAALMVLPESHWCGVSSFYQSAPQGPQDQPDFINAVAALDTALSPYALLLQLQAIERLQGRVKKRHWGERTLDLDILLYGDDQITLPELTVPHPRMAERPFVMLPLRELKEAINHAYCDLPR